MKLRAFCRSQRKQQQHLQLHLEPHQQHFRTRRRQFTPTGEMAPCCQQPYEPPPGDRASCDRPCPRSFREPIILEEDYRRSGSRVHRLRKHGIPRAVHHDIRGVNEWTSKDGKRFENVRFEDAENVRFEDSESIRFEDCTFQWICFDI